MVESSTEDGSLASQAFVSADGRRKLLLINRRERECAINLPGSEGAKLEVVDVTTGSNPPATSTISGTSFRLGSFGVAVVTLAK